MHFENQGAQQLKGFSALATFLGMFAARIALCSAKNDLMDTIINKLGALVVCLFVRMVLAVVKKIHCLSKKLFYVLRGRLGQMTPQILCF